jgi:hypothetical protein
MQPSKRRRTEVRYDDYTARMTSQSTVTPFLGWASSQMRPSLLVVTNPPPVRPR